MNIEQYLERIGIKDNLVPDFKSLKIIQRQHLLSIPFENLDIHANTRIELDLDKIFVKIVNKKRGGFCYELNGLLFRLLSEIGFSVKMISARVFKDGKYGLEYDHLAVIATIGSIQYLVDVGFGEFVFAPIELTIGKQQQDERGVFLIDKYDSDYFKVNKLVNGEQIPEYIFNDDARSLKEFNEMCKYHQESDASHFTQNRLISLPNINGRITLSNNTLKIRNGTSVEEREIEANEIQDILVTYFGFELIPENIIE